MRFPVLLVVILILGFALGHVAGLIVAALLLAVGYWGSGRLNPRVRHRSCNGTGRRYGWIYSWTLHRCGGCGGSGRAIRYGASRWGQQHIRDEATRLASARADAKRLGSWR